MRYRLSVRCNKNAATQTKNRPKTNGPTRRSQLVFWRIRPRFSGVLICLTDSTLFAPQRKRRTTTDESGSSFAASTSVLTLGTIGGNAPLRMARCVRPGRPPAKASVVTPQKSSAIRVMTWNIHGAHGRNPSFDLHRLNALIKAHQPDVIALQEIDSRRPGG